MIAEMTAADAKLDELLNAMNAATGEAKVSTIAQVRWCQVLRRSLGSTLPSILKKPAASAADRLHRQV